MNKDTLTTICGILIATGLGVQAAPDAVSPTVAHGVQGIAAIAMAVLGWAANKPSKPKV